jgi:hypothetical protein
VVFLAVVFLPVVFLAAVSLRDFSAAFRYKF